MILKRVALILGLLVSSGMFAQEESDRTKPPAPEFFLTTIPIRCVLRDYNIGFAQRIGWFHTVEVRIGWVHADKPLHERYERWLSSTEMLFKGPSFYLQYNKWRVNKKMKHTFWGVIAGYRYLFYEDRNFHIYDGDGRSYDDDITLSQWRNELLLMGTIGIRTTKISMSEISIGFRCMFTHTNVSASRIATQFPDQSQATFDTYIASRLEKIPNNEGFSILPMIRITSRFGWFGW